MKIKNTVVAGAVALAIGNAAGESLAVLYGMGHDGIDTAVLYQVDTVTGAATKVGVTPNAYLFSGGLTYNGTTNTLYATGYDMTRPSVFGAYSPALYEISRTSGVGILVGYLDPLNLGYMANGGGGLTWDSSTNSLFSTGCNRRMIPNGEACDSGLYRISPTSGQASLVGLSSVAGVFGLHGGGLAVQPGTNQLFATGWVNYGANSALFRIDKTTGAATVVGNMEQGQGLSYGGLDFDPTTDVLYANGWSVDQSISQLFRINLITGEAFSVGSTLTNNGLAMGGLAFAPAMPVPEPETYTLMLFALGLLILAERRKHAPE